VPVVMCTVLAACSSGPGRAIERAAPGVTSTSVSTVATSATTRPSPAPGPGGGEVKALTTPTGVVVPVLGRSGDTWRVGTPCGGHASLRGGTPIRSATVVLDPGHGGDETGAIGPNGLNEKSLNLAVATMAEADLERAGVQTVLTRTGDYRLPVDSRAVLIEQLHPAAFVSVHHNGGADGAATRPGTETYYQHLDARSKRLAGLLYEEVFRVFATRPGIDWHANVDAGAKWRLNSRGGDYYGILRSTAGVAGAISEGLFLTMSRSEADLLARPEVQAAEAGAIARAVIRFLRTKDPGSGFVAPVPRTTPATGGGATGCVDPALG